MTVYDKEKRAMKRLYVKPPIVEKALFCDIDGVLNRAEYGKDLYEDTYADYCVCLHRPSVEALRKLLIAVPDLKIVWISDWAKFETNACNDNHCYIDPLSALDQFSWIKERVVGTIFNGKYAYARGDEKIEAIEDFVKSSFVASYAILDDDMYGNTASSESTLKHLVHVNPLKSFLEDDLPIVEEALSLPTDKDFIHSALQSIDSTTTFTINGRYECRFDFSKYGDKVAPLFTPFAKDSSCPRETSSADVLVYDNKNGDHLVGMVVLSIDNDLAGLKDASVYFRHLDASSWEFGTTIIHLSHFMKYLAFR